MSMVLEEGAASGIQGGAQAAGGASLSVAGSAVPAALADSSNIPDYLATAQELETRDPAVADLGMPWTRTCQQLRARHPLHI